VSLDLSSPGNDFPETITDFLVVELPIWKNASQKFHQQQSNNKLVIMQKWLLGGFKPPAFQKLWSAYI
jgi:hypothetical protein